MTTIERTAYPRFKKTLSKQELQSTYTPTPEEITFARTQTDQPQSQLNLLVSLKSFQRLGYFPSADEIPAAIINHIRQNLGLPAEMTYHYPIRRTLYRHRVLIQTYLQVSDYAAGGQAVATAAIEAAAQQMGDPADLINVAIEALIQQRFELPAFSTLDHLVQRLRTRENKQIYTRVNDRLSQADKDRLDQLLILTEPETRTEFTRMKQAPAKATLSRMRQWEAHLLWLQNILTVSPFLVGIAPSRVQQFAAEAYALELGALSQIQAPRRYTLLLCLLQQMQVQARDSLVDMFLKRMRLIHNRARKNSTSSVNNSGKRPRTWFGC